MGLKLVININKIYMKRKSSKNRKLKYIRAKNFYRLGGENRCFFKISNELIKDENFEEYLHFETENILTGLEKKFKIEFHLTEFNVEQLHNDFINGFSTVEVKIRRKFTQIN